MAEYLDMNTTGTRFDLHVNHCLLALKLIIECKADATPVLLEERQGSEEVEYMSKWKLLDPPRQCRDYHSLSRYAREASICSVGCVKVVESN